MHSIIEFTDIYQANITRPGSEALLNWLMKSDFPEAPASTKYHGSCPGGLCDHSVNVYHELKRLLNAYPEIPCSDETAAVISLLHDVCKVDFYKKEYANRKIDGQWEQVPIYTIDEKIQFGGHGGKSVFLVQNYMSLTVEEAVAINCHMGAFDNKFVSKSYEQFPLAWLLHIADESASYFIETRKEKEK